MDYLMNIDIDSKCFNNDEEAKKWTLQEIKKYK